MIEDDLVTVYEEDTVAETIVLAEMEANMTMPSLAAAAIFWAIDAAKLARASERHQSSSQLPWIGFEPHFRQISQQSPPAEEAVHPAARATIDPLPRGSSTAHMFQHPGPDWQPSCQICLALRRHQRRF